MNKADRLDPEAPDFWHQVAKTQWGQYLTRIETRGLQTGIGECRRRDSALDIGAEQGRWTRFLLDHGWQRVTSTEICQKKVDDCQRCNPEAQCQLVSELDQTLPAESSSMDLVVSMETPVTEQAWFVPELERVLNGGGIGVFTITNRSSYRGALKNAYSRLRGEASFYPRRFSELRRELNSHGLSIVTEVGFSWLPFSRYSNSSLIRHVTPLERLLGLRRLVRYSPWVMVVCCKDDQAPLAENGMHA